MRHVNGVKQRDTIVETGMMANYSGNVISLFYEIATIILPYW